MFSKLLELINVLASLCTIYILYLTLYKEKIKLTSYEMKNSVRDGRQIGIVITNNGLKSIYIKKIDLIVDNNWKIQIYKEDRKNKDFFYLEGFKNKLIMSKPYTQMIINDTKDEELEKVKKNINEKALKKIKNLYIM